MGLMINHDSDPPTAVHPTNDNLEALLEETIARAQEAHDSLIAGAKLVTEIRAALKCLAAARTAVAQEQPPSRPEGSSLRAFLEGKRKNRAEVEEWKAKATTAIDTLALQAEERVRRYRAVTLNAGRIESGVDLRTASARVRAVHALASRIAEIIRESNTEDGQYATAIADFRVQLAGDLKTKKKPAGERKRYAALIEALSGAIDSAIELFEKTRVARESTLSAVQIVRDLDTTKIVEPQKPTAEEVGRYLHEIDAIARQQIPAERQAAENILTFRKYLTAFKDAVTDLTAAVRKASHLEALTINSDDDSVVIGGRQILECLRTELRNLVRLADDWVSRKYDDSVPVTEIVDEEHEIMEQLELQVRNLGNAVANKSIARAKYDQLKDVPEEKVANWEGLHGEGTSAFANNLKSADTFLRVAAEVNARVEKHNAIKMVAFDASEARRESARRIAVKLLGIATTIERTLKQPMSDELRVRLFAIKKLHKLNGTYY